MSLQFVPIARLVSIPALLINFKRNPTHWETTSCACRPRAGSDYALDCSLASRIRYLRIDTCNCLRSTHSRSLNNRTMSIQKETKTWRSIRKCWEPWDVRGGGLHRVIKVKRKFGAVWLRFEEVEDGVRGKYFSFCERMFCEEIWRWFLENIYEIDKTRQYQFWNNVRIVIFVQNLTKLII